MKKWIKKLLGIKEEDKLCKIPSELEIRIEIEKAGYPLKQKIENNRLIGLAKDEVWRMYKQWVIGYEENKRWKLLYPNTPFEPRFDLGIIVTKGPGLIYCYPGQKPISSEEYKQIRNKEFNRLKEEYLLTSP